MASARSVTERAGSVQQLDFSLSFSLYFLSHTHTHSSTHTSTHTYTIIQNARVQGRRKHFLKNNERTHKHTDTAGDKDTKVKLARLGDRAKVRNHDFSKNRDTK